MLSDQSVVEAQQCASRSPWSSSTRDCCRRSALGFTFLPMSYSRNQVALIRAMVRLAFDANRLKILEFGITPFSRLLISNLDIPHNTSPVRRPSSVPIIGILGFKRRSNLIDRIVGFLTMISRTWCSVNPESLKSEPFVVLFVWSAEQGCPSSDYFRQIGLRQATFVK